MSKVWQIASGDAGRRFTDLFLQHDVMFCGPGRFGLVTRRMLDKIGPPLPAMVRALLAVWANS